MVRRKLEVLHHDGRETPQPQRVVLVAAVLGTLDAGDGANSIPADEVLESTVTSVGKMPFTHSMSQQIHPGSHFSPVFKTVCLASTVRWYQPPPAIRYADLLPPAAVPRKRLPVKE